MDLLGRAVDEFGLYWLIVGRVSGLFFVLPIFGNRFVPPPVRIWLVLLTALALLPAVAPPPEGIPQTVLGYAGAFVRELAFGLAMGFLVALIFAVAEVAGQLLDVEMGFSLVNVIDPVYGQPMPMMGNFLHLVAMLLFLLVDGHHLILTALLDGFRRLPPGLGALTDGRIRLGLDEAAWMFTTAVKLAAPVLGVLFLSSVIMGLVARATPQLNVFVVGVPLKLALGLVGLAVAMPVYVLAMRALFPHAYQSMAVFLEGVGP